MTRARRWVLVGLSALFLLGVGSASAVQSTEVTSLVAAAVPQVTSNGPLASFGPVSAAAAAPARRLENGRIIKRTRGGYGRLKISNCAPVDAVISLKRKGAKRAYVIIYFRAGKSFRVRGVNDGTYRIYFTTGARWDSDARRFTGNAYYGLAMRPARFRTTRTATGIQFMVLKFTFWVERGNVATKAINAHAFPNR